MPASNYQRTLNIVKLLCTQGVFDEAESRLKLIETHISLIVLGSDFAWKFKKPVDFGFLDFSTLKKRKQYCEEELRLNSRFAENIYIDVIPISEYNGTLNLNGDGITVEYAVKMHRFDESKLLDELQTEHLLLPSIADDLAHTVNHFHTITDNAPPYDEYATPTDISHWFEENFDHIKPLLKTDQPIQQIKNIQAWGKNQITKLTPLMHMRRDTGFVRECHGDLHLGNIVLIDGQVTLFDCIEFNPFLRWTDIVCETAFLVMDLLHRGERALAFRFLNRYLELSGDYAGITLLPYYLSYRALVRAKVAILRINHCKKNQKAAILKEYQEYVDLASGFSARKSPSIIITHGLSGSGKSTYAQSLANNFGAIRIRSDVERKRLANIAEQASSHSSAGGGIYNASFSEQTYAHLIKLATYIVKAGFSVVVDATFLKASQRQVFEELAYSLHTSFTILTLNAPYEVLQSRITSRSQKGLDPSEASIEVLDLQKSSHEPLSSKEKAHSISIDTTSLDADSTDFLTLFYHTMTPY